MGGSVATLSNLLKIFLGTFVLFFLPIINKLHRSLNSIAWFKYKGEQNVLILRGMIHKYFSTIFNATVFHHSFAYLELPNSKIKKNLYFWL